MKGEHQFTIASNWIHLIKFPLHCFYEVLIIFPILLNIVPGVCPSGYEKRDGDIPGWGTDIGSRLSLTREGCANRCNAQARCLSFEHSNTEKLCNLNKIAEPTKSVNHRDYAFCTKTGGLLNDLHWCGLYYYLYYY